VQCRTRILARRTRLEVKYKTFPAFIVCRSGFLWSFADIRACVHINTIGQWHVAVHELTVAASTHDATPDSLYALATCYLWGRFFFLCLVPPLCIASH
jgi:hypothetical protein